ncbi:MAG: S41 family peptidase [Prevotellaceae bacterium]|jgi:carboxyl-terminal processing protease|nr:S41 family peptidase [Prevotellaceae bacterium]
MNKNVLLRVLTSLVCIVLGMIIGQYLLYKNADINKYIPIPVYPQSEQNKLQLVFDQIRENYVDPVNIDSLVEKTIPFVLEELDPHSIYIQAEDMEQANEAIEGNFDGVGITFNMPNDTVLVINVISGGPSERAGIHAGDRIITVDDSLIAGQKTKQDNVVKMLRGKTGTQVTVGIQRVGEPNLIYFPITRSKIPVKSIDVAYMLNEHTGYIRLSKFSKSSHFEFLKAASALQEKGMKNLIFDLRSNTGGLLDQAFEIANEFLPYGSLIVYTEGRARKRQDLYANGQGRLQHINVAVLTDEISASASEIVAGALQDNDRGLIVGLRTFGKGLVQEPINFSDNSGLRLTVARYYTPTGRSIQKPYGKDRNYEEDIYQRYLHGEFMEADSVKQDTIQRYTTPGGKIVYGGGGIAPDVFVPNDTTGRNEYFIQVSRKNLIYRYAIQFSDQHRAEINNIHTLDSLRKFYTAFDLLKQFTGYTTQQRIKPKPGELKQCKHLIENLLKAYIGRNTPLDDEGFYPFIGNIDNTLLQAVKELEKNVK